MERGSSKTGDWRENLREPGHREQGKSGKSAGVALGWKVGAVCCSNRASRFQVGPCGPSLKAPILYRYLFAWHYGVPSSECQPRTMDLQQGSHGFMRHWDSGGKVQREGSQNRRCYTYIALLSFQETPSSSAVLTSSVPSVPQLSASYQTPRIETCPSKRTCGRSSLFQLACLRYPLRSSRTIFLWEYKALPTYLPPRPHPSQRTQGLLPSVSNRKGNRNKGALILSYHTPDLLAMLLLSLLGRCWC